MSELLEVSRCEKKYLISQSEFRHLFSCFSKTLRQDSHNGDKGYLVRSLYFDSLDNGDYQDKVEGLEQRKKIRLRIYSPQDDFAKLELKQKSGQYQHKRSLLLDRESASRLGGGELSVLSKRKEPFASELYLQMLCGCYRPVCIVQYRRLAFLQPENRIRITFDYQVQSNESSAPLFSNLPLLYPVLHPDDVIMEVKYDGFLLSYIKDAISACNKTETSVSKYCLARTVKQ